MSEPKPISQNIYSNPKIWMQMRLADELGDKKDQKVTRNEMRKEFSRSGVGLNKIDELFEALYQEQKTLTGEVSAGKDKAILIPWLNSKRLVALLEQYAKLKPQEKPAFFKYNGIDPRVEKQFVATVAKLQKNLADIQTLKDQNKKLDLFTSGWAIACASKSKDVMGDLLIQGLLGVTSTPALIESLSSPRNGATNVTANTPIILVYQMGPNFDPRIASSLTKNVIINGVTVDQGDIAVTTDQATGQMKITITNSVNANYNATYIATNPVPSKYNYYNYSSGSAIAVSASFASPYMANSVTTNISFTTGWPIPSLASSSISNGSSVNPAGFIDLYFNTDGVSSITGVPTVNGITGLSNLRLKGSAMARIDQSVQGAKENPAIGLDMIRVRVSNLGTYGTPTTFNALDTNVYFEYQFVDAQMNGTVPVAGTTSVRINGTGAGYSATYASDSPIQGSATYDPATDTIVVTYNVAPAGFTDGSTVTFNPGEITINGVNVAAGDVQFWGSLQGAPANQFQVRIANNSVGNPRKYIGFGQSASVNINLASQSTFAAAAARNNYTFAAIADTRPTLNIPAAGASTPANTAVVTGPVASSTLNISTAGGAAGDLADLQNNSTFEVSTNGGAWVTVPLGANLSLSSMGGANFQFVHTPAGGYTTGNTYAFRVTTLNSATRVQPASFTRYFTVEKPILESSTLSSNPAEGAMIASVNTNHQTTFRTVDTNGNAAGVAADAANIQANLTATYSIDNGATWNAVAGVLTVNPSGGPVNEFVVDSLPAGNWPATSNVLLKLDYGAGANKIAPVTIIRSFTTP